MNRFTGPCRSNYSAADSFHPRYIRLLASFLSCSDSLTHSLVCDCNIYWSILLQFAGTRGIYCEQHLTNRIRSGKLLVFQPIKIINAIVSFLITVIRYAINKNRILVVHFINISSAIRKVAAWDLASANCWCWKIANCNLASVCVWQKHRWRWQPLPEVRQSPFF